MSLPEPYYVSEDGRITIYHGDCLELLPLVDGAVMVTDPPYGLEELAGSYGRHGDTIANDRDTTTRAAVLEMWGARPVLMFSTPRLPEPPGDWEHRLVWDKVEPGLNGGPWRYTHENVFVRGDGWARPDASSFSVLRFRAGNGSPDRALHPHRKPVELMRALLRAAPPGLIVDPFMGSGTTLRAAADLGRSAIGIEYEEIYCERAVERLRQGVLL